MASLLYAHVKDPEIPHRKHVITSSTSAPRSPITQPEPRDVNLMDQQSGVVKSLRGLTTDTDW